MASKENLIKLSAIISRNWSTTIEEDDSYIQIYPDSKTICCRLQGFLLKMVFYDTGVALNILFLDEASNIDMQPLMPSTKILQRHLGYNLQCKGVVPITTTIEGSKMCLGYYIFHHPGPIFILVGVPLHAMLRRTNNGECLKMAVGHQEFSTSFTRAINHAAKDELEEDLLQQVMATTLEEELSPPCLDDVVDYFSLAEEEVEFQDLEQEVKLETSPIKLKQLCIMGDLVLNWAKCHFIVREGIVLGHKISEKGIEEDKAKIEVIEQLPPPTNVKGIHSFGDIQGFIEDSFRIFLRLLNPSQIF
jgi:hypothetical protein